MTADFFDRFAAPAGPEPPLGLQLLYPDPLDLDPAATDRLASLYREARFSTHPLGEEARAAARDALAVLHADLAAGAGR